MPVRRALLAGAGALLLAAPLAVLAPTVAGAASCSDFSATASAAGARVDVESPGFLVVEQTHVGGPAAQAVVDSVGTSTGFAGYPDPGDEALGGPPTVGGATGLPIGRNTYPLITESQFPSTPESSLSTPAASLTAKSTQTSSEAGAKSGSDEADGVASAGLSAAKASAACADTGEVTAKAESVLDGLSFGAGTLRIGRIRSTASVIVGADGTPKVTSSLEVTQATVAGQTVGFTKDGLVLGTTATPLGDNPLAAALDGAGIAVSYLAAEPQPDDKGVIAPAIRIRITRDVTGGAPTVLTYTVGRAFVSAGAAPATAEAVADSGNAGSVDTAGTGDLGGPVATDGGAALGPLPTGSGPVKATPNRQLQPIAGTVPVVGFSAWSIYAVLVLAALVLLASGVLFKKLGVKLGWT
jgi:hypothetical protein